MVHLDPPTRWPLVPIKRFAQLVYGDALPAEKREVGGAVPVYGSNGAFGFHSSANTLSPVILVGRKGSVGALNWSDGPAFAIDTVYFVDEVHASCDLRWLYWALQTAGLHHLSQDTGVPGLSREMAYRVALPLPPHPEQTAIAAFLDRETGKIDALVAEQRRLIELLKEKRQAVISHALTKGLDPSARMKPSGVEWLGDMPEHWELVQLRRLIDEKRPITYGIVQPGNADPNGRYMVRGQDYSRGWTELETIFRVSAEVEEPYRRARLQTGDLVMTIVGAGTGNTAVVPPELSGANITQTTARIAPDRSCVSPEYLTLVMSSLIGRTQVALFQKGAAQPGLNLEHLKAFSIPLPPFAEQVKIAHELVASVPRYENLIATAEAAIELLLERRSALISAAVTGKIDVHNTAAEEVAA